MCRVQGAFTQPASPDPLVLHVAWALPLAALGLWFGLIDTVPLGEGRCSSCGVEGYVIAMHVIAAAWLGGVVAYAAAARRRLREGVATPGRITLAGLALVAVAVTACLAWHELLDIPAVAAMFASLVLFPVLGVGWVVLLIRWIRRPPRGDDELAQRLGGQLALAWVGLVVLLPAVFGWVWTDRVDWIVF
jgi:hypothetical protein